MPPRYSGRWCTVSTSNSATDSCKRPATRYRHGATSFELSRSTGISPTLPDPRHRQRSLRGPAPCRDSEPKIVGTAGSDPRKTTQQCPPLRHRNGPMTLADPGAIRKPNPTSINAIFIHIINNITEHPSSRHVLMGSRNQALSYPYRRNWLRSFKLHPKASRGIFMHSTEYLIK